MIFFSNDKAKKNSFVSENYIFGALHTIKNIIYCEPDFNGDSSKKSWSKRSLMYAFLSFIIINQLTL